MKRLFISYWLLIPFTLLILTACGEKQDKADQPDYKYDYETVEGDPYGALIYTLDNGLKVYMSINKDEPRIQTNIAVRAGSKHDPSDATGLAHYLEHMLFKGTSRMGTSNWEEEQRLLEEVSDLYEARRNTEDPEERKRIFAAIDSISNKAAEIAIANEYDKMMSSIGAQGTNAYTWLEQTVYINDIPSNEIEKWMMLESERFSELVLRLFHTELETVYEEFNMSQDSDYRIAYFEIMQNLFKKHTYGTQTTIGKGEHLKNPSMVKIHEYFDTYYVPNNMAVILAGDLDPDATVDLVKKYFGHYEPKELPEFTYEPEDEISEPIVKDVFGRDKEFVMMAYRTGGVHSDDALKVELAAEILNNYKAGLIDLNINQKQKALRASADASLFNDYGWLSLNATPKSGQSLEEVRELLLAEMENLKSGNFDDWLIDAAVRNLKLREIRGMERNWSRASKMTDAFIQGKDWEKVALKYERMSQITKEDLVAFAQKQFGDNYIAVNKKTGQPDVMKVEKPQITPLEIERDAKSEFLTAFEEMESSRLEPVFLNYEEAITEKTLDNGIPFSYIENTTNQVFNLFYILDMGSNNDKELAVAVKYLPYLGTSKYSAEDLQKEFFKLGISYDVFTSRDRVYIMLSGLEETMEEGMQLMEHVFEEVQANENTYAELVNDILKEREDNKLNKSYILYVAMVDYARYGEDSPLKDILTEEQLRDLNPEHVAAKIKELPEYEHRVFYYGTRSADEAADLIEKHHKVPSELKDYPEAKEFKELETPQNEVYFVNYDMVQSQLIMYSKGGDFNPELIPYSNMFNTYFGSGLSSIVFQEIRETKALAYSASSYFYVPSKKEDSHYVRSFVGTQVDKLKDAIDAMVELMNDMPESEKQFEDSKLSILKKIETNRITGTSIFWNYETAKNRGLDYDARRKTYEKVKDMSMKDMREFFNEYIKGRNYKYLVIGSGEKVDKNVLTPIGEYRELELEDIFGY